MASDRTRELTKELYDKCICTKAGDIWNEEAAVALLDAFERETRLDEAKWWHTQVALVAVAGGDDGHEVRDETRQRIAAIAAQPTPEVKK